MNTIYTAEGRAARVLTTLTDGRKVIELAYDDDGEIAFSGDLAIVPRVFDNPPTEVLHKAVADLEAREKQLRESINALRTECFDAERAHKERIAKLKQYEPLKFIEEFLDGKLTHYVIVHRYHEGCIRISTPAEEIDTEDRWNKKQKLLVLFGNPRDYSLNWYLSDESRAYPFTSLEGARAKAAELLAAAFKSVKGNACRADWVIESARALDMPVPDEVLQVAREYRQKSAQQSVDDARKKLAEAEKALAAMQGAA